jgi:DNA-directed RNA polymerase subunit K/omega
MMSTVHAKAAVGSRAQPAVHGPPKSETSAAQDASAKRQVGGTGQVVHESKRRKQLTRFERAHAIRSRANAIASGSSVRLKDTQGCTDALTLAERELDAGLLGDYVVRKCYPDGSYEEFGIYELAHVHR